jgi:hypothetical protein
MEEVALEPQRADKKKKREGMVSYNCNPSNSEGDQEDHGSRPIPAKITNN